MDLIETAAHSVFDRLWKNYTDLVVDARVIEQSLLSKGDVWNEDHVAFRTFPGPNTGMHVLRKIFESLGYQKRDDYYFEDKKLKAFWMEPPNTKGNTCAAVAPKIFVSELCLEDFSKPFQDVVTAAVAQVQQSPADRITILSERAKNGDELAVAQLTEDCVAFLSGGAPWSRPLLSNYELLRKESEYAAWTLVYGFNINHFTVSVQLMKSFRDIHALNHHVRTELKIPMNEIGGVTKGSPELRLEQSSTLAVQLPVLMQDGIRRLPYAFVEFAYRYPQAGKMADGMWESYYQGFVTQNADKIFESTNLR